jgi:DNA-binding NtrC family response regulator
LFSADAITMLTCYAWSGNLRELRQQVSRAMLLSHEGQITSTDLALPMQHKGELPIFQQTNTTLDDAEKAILLKVLADSRNNVSEAARKLGITRMTMRYRMDKHQISGKLAD